MNNDIYTIEKIQKIKQIAVKNYDVSIVIKQEVNLKEIILNNIIPELNNKVDYDELYLGLYEDKNLIGYGVTLGYIIVIKKGKSIQIDWEGVKKFKKRWNNRLTKEEAKIYKEVEEEWGKNDDSQNTTTYEQDEEAILNVAKRHDVDKKIINDIILKHTMQFC